MIRARFSTIAAASLTLALGACVSDHIATVQPVSRDIGPPPSDLQEVQVAAPRPGENAYAIAERERHGRKLANYVVCSLRFEWMRARVDFLAGQGDVPPLPSKCMPPDAKAPKAKAGASRGWNLWKRK